MFTTEDLLELTDAELTELRDDIHEEYIRRQELATFPSQIEAMTQRFVNHGGDKARIKNPNSYQPQGRGRA